MENIEIRDDDWGDTQKIFGTEGKRVNKDVALNGEIWKVFLYKSPEEEQDTLYAKTSSSRRVSITREYKSPVPHSDKLTYINMQLYENESKKDVEVRCAYSNKADGQPYLEILYNQDILPQLESVARSMSELLSYTPLFFAISRVFNHIKLCDSFIDREERKRSYLRFKNVVAVSSKDASFVPITLLLVGSSKRKFNMEGREIIEDARRYSRFEGYNSKGDKVFNLKYGETELLEKDDCYTIYPRDYHDMSRCPFVCVRNFQGGKPPKPEVITLAQEEDLEPYIQSFFNNSR